MICVLNLVLGSVLSDCGRLLYTVVYLKNSDALSCLVLGLYSGFSGGCYVVVCVVYYTSSIVMVAFS